MKLRNRFLLVGFGVVVFIVATPLLVLFTRGYQIDWTNRKFVKTGALVVRTLPNKAEVYLNNEKVDGATPETIRFILPGDYDIRIEKEGYQSWTKRLRIQAQLATWANLGRDFITLFYKDAQNLNNSSINFSSLSQNGREIAYVVNNQLNIYNVDNQTSQNLGDISNLSVPFTFSDKLNWDEGVKTLNFFRQREINIPFDVRSIQRILTDGSNLALIINDQLYILSDRTLNLIARSIRGAVIDGENLWYVEDNFLKQYNLRTNTINIVSLSIPNAATSQIIRGEGNTFLVLDNSLYVLNDTLEKIYDGVNFAQYDLLSHRLLFANSNEILMYNPGQKQTELIVRSISPVSNPVINFYTGYVFFQNENKIKAIELDQRDHRNVYTILELNSPSKFALNNEGSILTIFNDTNLNSYKIR